MNYDYLPRMGYCDECGAGWFYGKTLAGCSNDSCDFYISPNELENDQ